MEQRTTLDENYFYSCKELAFIWNVSSETVRRTFHREPGVLVLPPAPRKRPSKGKPKRPYHTLRIPGRVAIRVQTRMTVVE
jgi:hypothetical protein